MPNFLYDSHCHSIFSHDGTDSLEALCEGAIRAGLSGFCITDHYESQLQADDPAGAHIARSHAAIRAARERFGNQLELSCGVEIGQPLQNEAVANCAVDAHSFDFMLGSLHNLADMEDFYYLDYTQYSVEELLSRYYKELLEVAKWNRYDVLAHLTYPIRYIQGVHHIPVDLRPFDLAISEIMRFAIEHGKGIEINTSGLRQPIGETLPSLYYLKLYRKLGGEIVTVGSDAHCGADMGKGVAYGYEMLREAGFSYVAVYHNRRAQMKKI